MRPYSVGESAVQQRFSVVLLEQPRSACVLSVLLRNTSLLRRRTLLNNRGSKSYSSWNTLVLHVFCVLLRNTSLLHRRTFLNNSGSKSYSWNTLVLHVFCLSFLCRRVLYNSVRYESSIRCEFARVYVKSPPPTQQKHYF